MVVQWKFCSCSIFQEVLNDSCRTNLCNLLMMISEYRKFNMNSNHGNSNDIIQK